MFGWSKPTCTLDTLTRRWLEERWRWLKDQFGVDVVLDAPHVLPTPEYFPDQYDGGDDAVLVMTRRVCQYMSVPEDLVDFRFFSAENRPFLVSEHGKAVGGTAGSFEDGARYTIRIERLQAREPMTMVGTLAHELSHARLLGENRVDPDSFDHEMVTDLNVAFHGMGIFLANVPRHWDADARVWPGTQVPCPTYMTGPMLAYAMALRCCERMEALPKWRKHLKPAARAEFKEAYRFLTR